MQVGGNVGMNVCVGRGVVLGQGVRVVVKVVVGCMSISPRGSEQWENMKGEGKKNQSYGQIQNQTGESAAGKRDMKCMREYKENPKITKRSKR
jgi:hypothetical protein